MAGPVAGLAPVKNDPRPATDRGTVVPQSAAGPTSLMTNVRIAYSVCVRLPRETSISIYGRPNN